MDRGALSFTVDLCGYPHRLTNTHLESPDLLFWRSRNFRRQQVLALIGDQQAGRMILAGDFNLMMEGDADQLFPSTWIDAWLQLHPQEPGLTWDPAVNKMAYRQGGFVLPGYRLDRVLFRSDVLTPVNIRRVGVGIDKPLSDHFGLLAEFACNDRSL
jgi:endonuclease/exonuclease/phosphatase family metal-dependent hydrolase